MNISKLETKNLLNLVVLSIILIILNISFSIKHPTVTLNIGVTPLIGAILLTIKLKPYKDNKNAFLSIIFSWVIVISFIFPLIFSSFSSNIIPTLEYIASIDTTNPSINQINEIFYAFEMIHREFVILSAVSLLSYSLPRFIFFYFLLKFIIDICSVRNLTSSEIKKSMTKWNIVTLVMNLLIIPLIDQSLYIISSIRVNDQGELYLSKDINSAIGTVSIFSIITLILAICYLVYLIKIFISLNKISKENNNSFETSTNINY